MDIWNAHGECCLGGTRKLQMALIRQKFRLLGVYTDHSRLCIKYGWSGTDNRFLPCTSFQQVHRTIALHCNPHDTHCSHAFNGRIVLEIVLFI